MYLHNNRCSHAGSQPDISDESLSFLNETSTREFREAEVRASAQLKRLKQSDILAPAKRSSGSDSSSSSIIASIPMSPKEFADTHGLVGRQSIVFQAYCAHAVETLTHLVGGTIQDQAPKPEHWILIGEGGSGKTYVLQKIIDYFAHRGWSRHLRVSATTGAAASNLERLACTIDSLAGLKRGCEKSEGAAALKRSMDLGDVYYVIIDEYSMLCCAKLAKVLQSLQHGQKNGSAAGRISILFSGDPFQFAPVDGHSLSLPALESKAKPFLGQEAQPNQTQINTLVGASFWANIHNVIVLDVNHRQTSCSDLKEILSAMRTRHVSDDQVRKLKTRLLAAVPVTDAAELSQTQFIVQRNTVRVRLNAVLVPFAASISRVQGVHVVSKDVFKRDNQEYNEKLQAWVDSRASERMCGDLPREVIYYVGQKVRFLHNTAPQFGVANGSIGTIEKIIMEDSEQPAAGEQQIPIIKAFPLQILVSVPLLGGRILDEKYGPNIIPIKPARAASSVNVNKFNRRMTITFTRTAFPLIPTLCVTDYKAQGHTYDSAIVDLQYPPGGRKDYILAVYVMLSRVKSLNGLRILTDFTASQLQQPFPAYITQEWNRLNRLCTAYIAKLNRAGEVMSKPRLGERGRSISRIFTPSR